MTNVKDNCIIGIVNSKSNNFVGLGLLLNTKHILTCAHVVNTALNRPRDTISKPNEDSIINFTLPKLKRGNAIFSASIEHWQPRGRSYNKIDDFAILKISEFPFFEHFELPQFYVPDSFLNRNILAFGFPAKRKTGGKNITGICIDSDAIGLIEIVDKNHSDIFIQDGFSGTPVFEIESNTVIGIICSKVASIDDTGHMIPLEIVHDVWDGFELRGRKKKSPKELRRERENEVIKKRIQRLEDGERTLKNLIYEFKKKYEKEVIGEVLTNTKKDQSRILLITLNEYEDLKNQYSYEIDRLNKGELSQEYIKRVMEEEANELRIDLTNTSKLPPKDNYFIGRKDTLIKVLSLLTENDSVSLTGMKGMGGAGKTAIAVEVCYIIKESWKKKPKLPQYIKDVLKGEKYFQDGILWIRFEQDENIRVLIHEKIEDQIDKYFKEVSVEDKLKSIFKYLQSFDILIVLDSAEQNENNFRIILRYIKNYFPVLVTSRKDFSFIESNVSINEMLPEEALELFKNHYLERDTKFEPEELEIVRKISKEVGYLPLAIKILAKKAKIYKLSIEELYKEYKENSDDLSFFEFEEFAGDILEDKDIERVKNSHALYCISLSCQPLTKTQKDIFIRCGLPYFPFSIDEIASLPVFKSIKKMGFHLGELVRLSLIEKDYRTKRYFLHPLVRQFALYKAKEEGIIDSLYEEKISAMLDTSPEKFDDNSLAEILRLIRYATEKGDFPKIYAFNEHLDKNLRECGLWERKNSINEYTLSILDKLENTEEKRLNILSSFADVIGRQGYYEREEKIYKEIINLEQKAGKFPNGKFYSEYRIVSSLKKQKRLEESIETNFKYIKEILDKDLSIRFIDMFVRDMGLIYLRHNLHEANIMLATYLFREKAKSYNLFIGLQDIIDYLMLLNRNSDALILTNQMFDFLNDLKHKELSISNLEYYITLLIANKEIYQAKEKLNEYKMNSKSFGFTKAQEFIQLSEAELMLLDDKINLNKILNLLENVVEESPKKFELLARTNIKLGNLEIAEEQINKVEFLYQDSAEIIKCTKLLTLRAILELQRPSIIHSIQYINESISLQKRLGIRNLEEEEKVVLELENRIGKITYNNFSTQCNVKKYRDSDLTPDFKISGLPDFIYDKLGKKMVLIPEGLSYYGSGEPPPNDLEHYLSICLAFWRDGVFESEKYSDATYLYPFYIDIEPVSDREFYEFEKQNQDNQELLKNYTPTDKPKINISYNKANEYSYWLGKDIPNQYEWEKVLNKRNQYLYKSAVENTSSINENFILAKSATIIEEGNNDDFLKFIINEKSYSELYKLQINLDNLEDFKEKIMKQNGFHDKTSIDLHLIISPELRNSLSQITWINLFRLIAYSTSLNSLSRKMTVLDKLHELSNVQVEKLFSILFNEIVSLYLLSKKNDDDYFLRECKRQAEFWKAILFKKLKIEGNLDVRKTLLQEFIKENKMINTDFESKPVEVIENYTSQNLGFRCIVPVFSNTHFKELIKNKILNHAF